MSSLYLTRTEVFARFLGKLVVTEAQPYQSVVSGDGLTQTLGVFALESASRKIQLSHHVVFLQYVCNRLHARRANLVVRDVQLRDVVVFFQEFSYPLPAFRTWKSWNGSKWGKQGGRGVELIRTIFVIQMTRSKGARNTTGGSREQSSLIPKETRQQDRPCHDSLAVNRVRKLSNSDLIPRVQ